MMAASSNNNVSRKKQQEERNLKLLRELGSQLPNKQCFDCHQRGPTYVNMTIGSFVCTKCSGLLRGLNPPHRVKSISMATFAPDEIEFLKARGNDYCKKVWTGRYTATKGPFDDGAISKDETQMKDYLVLKYEKKRWYINPSQAMSRNGHMPAPASPPSAILHNTPSLFPRQGDIKKSKVPSSLSAPSQSQHLNILFDPFDDFGSSEPAKSSSFQNFNFPKSATVPTQLMPQTQAVRNDGNKNGHVQQGTATNGHMQKIQVVVKKKDEEEKKDKYSALAELDEQFHGTSVNGGETKNGYAMDPRAYHHFPPPHAHLGTNAYAKFSYSSTNNFYPSSSHMTFGSGHSQVQTATNPFSNPQMQIHQQPLFFNGLSQQDYAKNGNRNGYGQVYRGMMIQQGFAVMPNYAQGVNSGMNPFMNANIPAARPATATQWNPFL